MIFRIDDVSANTNTAHLQAIVTTICARVPDASIVLAISPLVHDVSGEPEADRERAFPRLLSAMSDHRNLYRVRRCGWPEKLTIHGSATLSLASHGLVHVDHRLLGREAQELSIVASCSLVGAQIFCPPFNHWNRDTESVCAEHGIELIKFEDGWRHVRFNKFDPKHERYYLHTHDTAAEWLAGWFE